MLCTVLHKSAKHNNPLHFNEELNVRHALLKLCEKSGCLKKDFYLLPLRHSCFRKLKPSKHVFTHHSTLISPADVRPLTLDDSVVGDNFHASSVVIKCKVPHPCVQVLDESCLVDGDRVIDAGPCVWFAQGPLLFGNKPAAIQ